MRPLRLLLLLLPFKCLILFVPCLRSPLPPFLPVQVLQSLLLRLPRLLLLLLLLLLPLLLLFLLL